MPTDLSGAKAQLVSPDASTDSLARAIRLRCMVSHDIALKQLARESGVAEARLRKFLSNDSDTLRHPRLDEALSIWAVLGAESATSSTSLAGIRCDSDEAPAARLCEAVTSIIEGAALLSQIAQDDRIDAHEGRAAQSATAKIIKAARQFCRRAARAESGVER